MSIAMVRKAILLIALMSSVGCQDTDLSSSDKYASVIGAEFRTKTDLFALGVYGETATKELGSVRLSAVQQSGPEVAFRRPVPKGSIVRVLKVRKRFIPFENGLEFVVRVDGVDLPNGVELILPLYGSLQSSDGLPDSSRFERLPLR